MRQLTSKICNITISCDANFWSNIQLTSVIWKLEASRAHSEKTVLL